MKNRFNKSCYFTIQKDASKLDCPEGENITVTGMASTWNTDLVGDEMLKGCFTKSLNKSQGRYFVLSNHNPDNVIGVNKSAVETEQGLYVKFDLWNTPENQKYITLVKKSMELNMPLGLSIGGKIVKADLNKESRGFKVSEFDLMEHSITPIPANQESRIEFVKSYVKELKNKQANYSNEAISYLLRTPFLKKEF